MQIHGHCIDGKILYQQIVSDLEQKRAQSLTMGARHYRMLKAKFSKRSTTLSKLDALCDRALSVSPALLKCMKALSGASRSKGLLIEWMLISGKCNAREAIGLFKVALQMQPVASSVQRDLCLGVMRYFEEFQLQKSLKRSMISRRPLGRSTFLSVPFHQRWWGL